MRLTRKCRLIVLLALGLLQAMPVLAQEHQHHQEGGAPDDGDACERNRWMWQLPEQVMAAIGVAPGMVVADVGAGTGYFTFRLAEKVGGDGLVYANEIDEEALEVIRVRAEKEKVATVRVVLGTPEDAALPDSTFDRILLVNVIHLVEKPVEFLAGLRQDLKPGGQLVLVQWDAHKLAREMPGARPEGELEEYLTADTLAEMKAAGFEIAAVHDFLPLQEVIVGR